MTQPPDPNQPTPPAATDTTRDPSPASNVIMFTIVGVLVIVCGVFIYDLATQFHRHRDLKPAMDSDKYQTVPEKRGVSVGDWHIKRAEDLYLAKRYAECRNLVEAIYSEIRINTKYVTPNGRRRLQQLAAKLAATPREPAPDTTPAPGKP